MAPTYWLKRAALKQAAYDRANDATIATVNKAYDRAIGQLNKDIDKVFATYVRKTGLTPQEARKYLTEGISSGIVQTDAYRARITRMQAIQESTRKAMTEAATVELKATKELLKGQAEMAYARTLYDIQSSVGMGFLGTGIPNTAMREVLSANWSGLRYSTRVWQNRDAMVQILKSAMLEQASIGKLSDLSKKELTGLVDLNKWKQQLKSKFKTEAQYAKYAAERLIRTESAFVCNQTDAVVYKECGVEKYEFIATLDTRTSEACQEKDGEFFPVEDKEVGVNFPPLHPHCRSTTGAVIDGVARDKMQRRARKADGSTELVPRDMKYAEWKRWQADGAPDLKQWRNANGYIAPVSVAPVQSALNVDRFTQSNSARIDPPAEYKEMLARRFEKGTPEAQAFYDKYVPQGGRVSVGTERNPHYDTGSMSIKLDFKGDLKGKYGEPGTPWFHEHFHSIDFSKNVFSANSGISLAVKKDVANFLAIHGDKASSILKKLPDSAAGVSDIFSGATGDKVSGMWGHTAEYWSSKKSLFAQEVFANFGDASFSTETRELMKTYFPQGWAKFTEVIKEML